MDWIKILSALFLVAMAIVIWPAAKHWLKHSPKAKEGDWQAAIIPLLLVVGFVALLIMMV